jgi:ubiquinone/menaquinone biosynthesis C-methylase UbiE
MSSRMPDTKEAEKQYLRRSNGGAWESSKPFPPAGQVATEEHAQHIHDFSVLLRVLDLQSDELILDLGAGSGWVSDWLRRCGFKTVACDISHDMLRLARERLPAPERVVTADMEALPFASKSFSKACCLNAFHHVPDQLAALKEIRRVLADDGVVFFSEPGKGHATNPTSLAAVRNYGVQENEIIIRDFMDACSSAGFADVRLRPIAHVIPLFELTRSQWSDWNSFAGSSRPTRALQKLYRACLEFAGLGKKDLLFEEAFAIRLVRELHATIEEHPIITAHCRAFEKPSARVDKAVLAVTRPYAFDSGDVTLDLHVTNAGTTSWNTSHPGEVAIGIQLLDASHHVVNRDYARQALPSLGPGSSHQLTVRFPIPSGLPAFAVKIDVVREGLHWFELSGTAAVVFEIKLTGVK